MLNLQNLTYAECQPFCPNFDRAKCVRVQDGDTIDLATRMDGYGAVRHTCRLVGIVVPDIRAKQKAEKTMAKIAREELRDLILHRVVAVTVHGTDKYGRLLIHIAHEKGDVAELLIAKGVATALHTPRNRDHWMEMLKAWMLQNPSQKPDGHEDDD